MLARVDEVGGERPQHKDAKALHQRDPLDLVGGERGKDQREHGAISRESRATIAVAGNSEGGSSPVRGNAMRT